MNRYTERIVQAQERMQAEGIAAMLLAPTEQMQYLIGWRTEPHERLLALFLPVEGQPVLIAPSINAAQARTNPAGITSIWEWRDSPGWMECVASLLKEWRINGRTFAIDDMLPACHLLAIQHLAPYARYVSAGDIMNEMRAVKSEEELQTLSQSAAITDAVYQESLNHLKAGMTELDLEEVITHLYGKHGVKPAFCIVCFGKNSAEPHHEPDETPLRPGDIVLMDIGCIYQGYASDITRMVSFGESNDERRKIYRLVRQAHQAAFDSVKPGVACEEVDAAARRVIEKAGLGDHFFHRTGHGIGLSVHERPFMVEGNKQKLKVGMCFSIEPGVYFDGRWGVRIENIVAVGEEGGRYLNAIPPEELLFSHS